MAKKLLLIILCSVLTVMGQAKPLPLPFVPMKSNFILLVDVSSSMEAFDTNHLRESATRFFVALVPKDAHVGIYQFASTVEPVIPFAPVTPALIKQADKASSSFQTLGVMTRLDLALQMALAELKGADGTKHILLISDGNIDLGNTVEKNRAMKKDLIEHLIPQLQQANVHVHAIARNHATDLELLHQLTGKTQGVFQTVRLPDQMYDRIQRLFDRITFQAYQDNLNNENFDVKNQTNEVSVIISDGEANVLVVDPESHVFSEDNHPNYIDWARDPGFQIITIKAPIAGRWHLKSARDLDSRVIIMDDYDLRTNDIPNKIFAREHILVNAAMMGDGEIIYNPQILKYVQFSVKVKSDKDKYRQYPLRSPDKNGIYQGDIVLESPGLHELTIEAKSPSFKRSVYRMVDVQETPVKMKTYQMPADDRLFVDVMPKSGLIEPSHVSVEAIVHHKESQRTVKLHYNDKCNCWKLSLSAIDPGDAYSVYFRLMGEDDSGRQFTLLTDSNLVYPALKMEVDFDKLEPYQLPQHLPMIYRLDELSQDAIGKIMRRYEKPAMSRASDIEPTADEDAKKMNELKPSKFEYVKSDDPTRDFLYGASVAVGLLLLLMLYLRNKSVAKRKVHRDIKNMLS